MAIDIKAETDFYKKYMWKIITKWLRAIWKNTCNLNSKKRND